MFDYNLPALRSARPPWNWGRIVGQERPLLPQHVWSIRVRLELAKSLRDLALFNLAIDSKLRGCDLVRLKLNDLMVGRTVRDRVTIIQRKTSQPVRFEVTEHTRKSILAWTASPRMAASAHLYPSRMCSSPHLSTRQYARLVKGWVSSIGLDPSAFGTHSLRRTKAALIWPRMSATTNVTTPI